jgi:hypothetical protein
MEALSNLFSPSYSNNYFLLVTIIIVLCLGCLKQIVHPIRN